MTPLRLLMFGTRPVTAVGTDLLFAAATRSIGTLVNGLHRTVAWRVTGLLAVATRAVVGMLVSLTSVGAGAVGIIGLLLVYPRMPAVLAGTLSVVAVKTVL